MSYISRMNAVTRALLAARDAMRLDQNNFAALLDIDVAEVQAWEAGTRNARSSALIRCARALALTVEEVLDGEIGRASVPSLFLRATEHEGKLSDLLELSPDLALFVEVARALDRLQRGALTPVPPLPVPPADARWGVDKAPYRADELATWLRSQLGITTAAIPSMRAIYERLGIGIVWARQAEMSPSVDGASLRSPRPTVLVHLVEGPACWWRTRMTLAHELCHLLCDLTDERHNLALISPASTGDAEAAPGSRAAGARTFHLFSDFAWIEQRASAFASHFLVPDHALRATLSGRDPVAEDAVTTVCTAFGVGRITAVSRIKHVFGLSEDLRLQMLRRPHEERHASTHPDLAPPRCGLRSGVLLDEVAAALAQDRIDRVEAHRVLGLALHEPLPEHPELSASQRLPLRSVGDSVRDIARVALARAGAAGLSPGEVRRGDAGWCVAIVDATGRAVREEVLSFYLDAERAKISA
ncbi:helix-turn-helix domain-containing protein [Sorangium sp. So ce124]|uniref:helix-turn-helix domain-containing protein n=1 Tax=Sorangium sp. So ce124 TaxID=3133280 RepID=UPI003F5F0589